MRRLLSVCARAARSAAPAATKVCGMRHLGAILACGLGLFAGAAQGAGGDWLTTVFPERAYDFGTVARGSQIRHSFPVVNRTGSEIRIATWRTKCGCTNVRVGARVIPPGTQTTVEATVDTTKFQGYKASGLTLVLDRPAFVELDLNLSCFIRGDLTLVPGQFDFGILRRSAKLPSASMTVTYAGGRSDWEITDMKTETARVKAEAKEISRTADGQIRWRVTASLQPGIGDGYFKDEITLITNDHTVGSIPISVVANVRGAVSATPSIVSFGPVDPGYTVSKTVHVRSSTPFSITKLSSTRGELEPLDSSKGPSTDHAVTLKLKAPDTTGPFHAFVKIETDAKDEPPTQVKAFATITPPR
jgi:hypothetical protein